MTAEDSIKSGARPSLIWRFANPHEFMRLSGVVLPRLAPLAIALVMIGTFWALLLDLAQEKQPMGAPFRLLPLGSSMELLLDLLPYHEQGERQRILFVHVPAAFMGVNIYMMMVVASLIGLIRRHPVAHLAAKAAAPVGAAYTLIALISGGIWGQPTWGAYWDWGDARLLSALILFFFYMGYIALWNAIEEPTTASELAAVLCLFGSIFAFLARYASFFWQSLHQGPSLSGIDGTEEVSDGLFYPLMLLFLAHYLLFFTLLFIGMRTEIRARRLRALRLAEAER